ncbi:MAG: hypothetical protein JWQ90_5131 [Hydrocarboniphaga sp.]|uniref:alginate export family protein n=1 Tax=Hydrocarboniphaga sp. TaxID=2033016 RepID=UPI00260FDD38|nr:alginate export family protein [Hydrocarboniphaga sp.]MDB5972681.1 hypothetical protein [Hydrocarboniphaga sp.]
MSIRCFNSLVAAAILAASTGACADGLDTLQYAASGGTPNIDARLRYEQVDQDNLSDDANALTARVRLGYTTGKWNNIDGQLEYEGVTVLGSDKFNSTTNGQTGLPVVADPKTNELNQGWIRYSGLPKTTIKYGRQRLIYDNARYIGNVGWRQNEQTYDALSLSSTWLPKTTFNYAYIYNVDAFKPFSIGGKSSSDIDIKAHAFNLAYAPLKTLTLSAYAYLLDFDAIPAPPIARQDTQSLGLRAVGTLPLDKFTLSYTAEYAQQSDYADAPSTVDADYYLIETGLAYDKYNAKIGYEVLGGDGVYSFQTPLATLHAFQGWADQFLVTPVNGIKDLYFSVGGNVEKVALLARWHDYRSDEASIHYGTELELQATRPFTDQLSLGLKYAAYSAKDFPAAAGTPFDTTKTWLWLEYKF